MHHSSRSLLYLARYEQLACEKSLVQLFGSVLRSSCSPCYFTASTSVGHERSVAWLGALVRDSDDRTGWDQPFLRSAMAHYSGRPSRHSAHRAAQDPVCRLVFNQVLPTAVGGDVVRAWRCHQLGPSLAVAIRSVLLDRVCGFAMLGALSCDLTRSTGHRS